MCVPVGRRTASRPRGRSRSSISRRVVSFLPSPVDGDHGGGDLGDRGASTVDQPAELAGRDRGGQSLHSPQGDPAGRVPEDDPLLFECPEQAAQGGQQVVRRDAGTLVERFLNVVPGDLAQAGDVLAPAVQDRAEAVEVAADRGEREFLVRPAALSAYYLHPLADLAGDDVGEGVDVVADGALDGGALTGGVGDDHAAVIKELQDPPDSGAGTGAECPDVVLVDKGVGPEPGEQDPEGLGRVIARPVAHAAGSGVPVEPLNEGAGCGRQGGQMVQFAGVEEAPVTAGFEQHALRGIDQVRRDRLRRPRPARLDRPPGGGDAGGLLVLAVRGQYQRRCPGQADPG